MNKLLTGLTIISLLFECVACILMYTRVIISPFGLLMVIMFFMTTISVLVIKTEYNYNKSERDGRK